MKQILVACIVALGLSHAALAQEAEDDGLSLMEEGAKLFFRGLMEEMEPALRELEEMGEQLEPSLRDFAEEMGPALRDLFMQIEDWSVYHPPEVLPNGDIIIRRKTPQELLDEPEKTEEEIEL